MRRQSCVCIFGVLLALTACVSEPTAAVVAATPGPVSLAAAPVAPGASLPALAPDPSDAEDHVVGEQLYQERCASCHDAGRAPPRGRIAANSPREILEALDSGFMAAIAQFMTPEQKMVLAQHLSNAPDP